MVYTEGRDLFTTERRATMRPGTEVTLCPSGYTYNCPKVHFDGGAVVLTDDLGGRCLLTPMEWNRLIDNIERRTLTKVETG